MTCVSSECIREYIIFIFSTLYAPDITQNDIIQMVKYRFRKHCIYDCHILTQLEYLKKYDFISNKMDSGNKLRWFVTKKINIKN